MRYCYRGMWNGQQISYACHLMRRYIMVTYLHDNELFILHKKNNPIYFRRDLLWTVEPDSFRTDTITCCTNTLILYICSVLQYTCAINFLYRFSAFRELTYPVDGTHFGSGVSCHGIYFWPQGAVPQALTLFGGVGFIARRLRCSC